MSQHPHPPPLPPPRPHAPARPAAPAPPRSGVDDRTFERNAYAIAFRLLGDRAAAAAVAGIAAERLRQSGHAGTGEWLRYLTLYTVEQTVGPGVPPIHADADRYASMRAALRRRLARAQPDERVAGGLLHLAGYPEDFVANVLGRSPDEVRSLARVLAPPPGLAYRELGDPALTGAQVARPDSPRGWRPRWTTVAVGLLLVVLVVAATRMTGPRPTLGPPVEEGSAPAEVSSHPVDGQRNGGPLTQQTRE